MVEGAPLLREYGPKVHRGFESLSLRQINAPVAQLDRVSGYEPGGRRFESFRARHLLGSFPITGALSVQQQSTLTRVL